MIDARPTFRHTVAVLGFLTLSAAPPACALAGAVKTVKPVPFADVQVDLGLWAKRLEISRTVAIPESFKHCEETGRIDNCAEWPDNDGKVLDIVLDDDVVLKAACRKDLLHGLTVLTGTLKSGKKFTAIPFYARAHRDRGEMNVWIARTQTAAKRISTGPFPHDWEACGPLKASQVYPPAQLAALDDSQLPESFSDLSVPYFTWLYHVGGNEWVQKTFAKPTKVSSVEVYWLDQGQKGPCRMPTAWRVLYRHDNRWKAVENIGPYRLDADKVNKVEFQPVTTTIIRMEAALQRGFSGGMIERRVE